MKEKSNSKIKMTNSTKLVSQLADNMLNLNNKLNPSLFINKVHYINFTPRFSYN